MCNIAYLNLHPSNSSMTRFFVPREEEVKQLSILLTELLCQSWNGWTCYFKVWASHAQKKSDSQGRWSVLNTFVGACLAL